jgi:Grx4 family monothiol glutaredoxin
MAPPAPASLDAAGAPSARSAAPVTATSEAHLGELTASQTRVVLNFCAEWAPPCVQMNSVFAALAAAATAAADPAPQADPPAPTLFVTVPAELLPVAAAEYRVSTVPSFVLLYAGRIVARVEGADPPLLAERVKWLATAPVPTLETAALVEATREDEIMLFIKGSPDQPKCGFSRQIVELLRKSGVVFGHRDILKDQWLREELKKLHNWPTYPQLYARARLIGGLDIVRELVDMDELVTELSREDSADSDVPTTESRPDSAASKAVASTDEKVTADPLVDRGTDAPISSPASQTRDKPPRPAIGATPVPSQRVDEALNDKLRALVSRSPVMLFIKGVPDAPRCGFSRKIVALLREQDITFDSFDILEDPQVRQGLKDMFSWPTYPQLYSKGELIGGLDIVQDLAQSGSFRDELGLNS